MELCLVLSAPLELGELRIIKFGKEDLAPEVLVHGTVHQVAEKAASLRKRGDRFG